MRDFNWSGLDKWQNPPDAPCDCNTCEECHDYHRKEQEFPIECERCQDEKCKDCAGTGYEADGETDCVTCKTRGRILWS